VLRIAAFGDSFTHGDEVRNEDTWQEAMMRANRNLEVLNFGVGGFGLDQAFLRYQQDGAVYKPRIVLIGFHTADIYRNVNVFRPFLSPATRIPLTKPRYIFERRGLVLLQNPIRELSQYRDLLTDPARVLPELGTHDYFFQKGFKAGHFDFLPSVRLFQVARYQLLQRGARLETGGHYNVDSEAFKVTVAIFDQFVDAASHNGSEPIVVMMPGGSDIKQYSRNGMKPYAPLLEYFRAKGYRYVDMFDGFRQYAAEVAVRDLVPSHYSPLGNALVAKVVWQYLVENRLIPRLSSVTN